MLTHALMIVALSASAAASQAQTAPPAAAKTAAKPAATPAPPPRGAAPVPRATFVATMDAEFRKIDADKDGKLTKAEIEGYQRAVAMLQMQARNRALFARLDADKNGQLTAQEFAALRLGQPTINAAPVLAQTDLNKDKAVTLVEYRTSKLVNFDRMDTDKDSVVSVAEMRAAGLIK